MDGIGGCVKNMVYRTVMSEREVIKTPKEFAECADRSVKGIHCLYQPIEEMMEEPVSIKEAPYSTSMQILKVHKAQRLILPMDSTTFYYLSPLYRRKGRWDISKRLKKMI